MKYRGDGRVPDHRRYERKEWETKLIREGPECCGGDELGKWGWEEFWVRMMRFCCGEGERGEEAEEEPSEKRCGGNEGVKSNQTVVRTWKVRICGKTRSDESTMKIGLPTKYP
jgi:hypothetical protein